MLSARVALLLGLSLVIGLGLFGHQVRRAVQRGREFDRFLTVRGLSEREVKADRALWPIRFETAAEDLLELRANLEKQKSIVISYLKNVGMEDGDVIHGLPEIEDRQDQKVREPHIALSRYKATPTIVVRSANVDVVKKAIQGADSLLTQGIAIQVSEYGRRPEFSFNGVNTLKPQMIAEATANARAAAEKFAADSKSQVGSIRKATQGVVEIDDRDPASPELKVVRVVTTVEFFLE